MYKLICIDMDGTLLNKDFNISEFNATMIKEVKKLGTKIAIVTGRPYNVASYFKKVLGDDIYVIGTNGTYFEVDNNIFCDVLTKDEILDLYNIANKYQLTAHFKGKNIVISNEKLWNGHPYKMLNPLLGNNEKLEIIEGIKEDYIVSSDRNNINKCIFISEDINKLTSAKNELMNIGKLEVVSSGKLNFEVMPKGSSKGNSIKKLASILNINKEHIISIGDNENDISMFRESGYSVVMGNAPEYIKELGDYITKSNEESGVGYALKEIFLL